MAKVYRAPAGRIKQGGYTVAAPTKPKPQAKAPAKPAPDATPIAPRDPLQSLIDSYASQAKALESQQAAQRQSLSDYTDRFMSYLAGLPGKIGGNYDTAINQANALAQTAATGLANLNPGSESSYLSGIGAPSAQQAQLAAQNQNVFGGGAATLYDVAGAVPGKDLAAQKAAQMSFLDELPGIQQAAGREALKALLANQSGDYEALLGKQNDSLQSARNDIAKLLPSAAKAPTVKKIGNAYYQWDSGKGWVKVASSESPSRTGQVRLANGQYVTTVDGSPVGNPWGPVKVPGKGSAAKPTTAVFDNARWQWDSHSGSWTRLGTYGAGSKGKSQSGKYTGGTGAYGVLNGMTTTSAKKQILAWKNTASIVAERAFNGTKDKDGKKLPPLSYQSAMTKLLAANIPLDIAQQALNRYWTKPGDETNSKEPGQGRPLKGFQQRNPNMASSRQGGAGANATVSTAVSHAISAAESELGKPYVFGSGPDTSSFDCSDLIQYAYKQVGVRLPRTTYQQIKSGFAVNWRSASDLRPGDLIFPHKGHVVLYVGDGRVIAAPHTGTVVQFQPVSNHLVKGAVVRRIVRNGLV